MKQVSADTIYSENEIVVDPNLGLQLFLPLSWVLAQLSSIRLAQHLQAALSSMPVCKNFPLFHLLGVSQNA